MSDATISPAAAEDLIEIAEYLDTTAFSVTLGNAFLQSASATIAHLEAHPESGRLRRTSRSRLAKVRSLVLDPPFSKYLVFYQINPDDILILRVLHGAQNLKRIAGVSS